MRQGLRRIEFLAAPDSGVLRIGCSEITMAGLIAAIAEEFSQRYPRIQLQVILATTAALQFQELRERNVDLLIVRLPRPLLEDDLNAETLFDEPFQAVAGVGSKWARRRQIALADLVDEPWVLPPYDSVPGAFILEIFRASKLQPPSPRIVSLSGQLTVTLIAGGRFVGVLPSSGRAIQRQAGWVENIAGKIAGPAICGRHDHRQESHSQSIGRAVHGLRAGHGKIDIRSDKGPEVQIRRANGGD
jgi:DNA-binding transcriptional LysR family regulator